MGMRVLLWYAPKEIRCPTHGRVQEDIPWAPANARITYRLEWRICALCQTMTQKAAAAILVLPTSTLSNLLHRVITRVRVGHRIRGVTTLGVDEISFCKGRKFATLVYDLDRARVLWVGRGKGRETIDRFFTECLSTGQKARITWASCDMSPTYTGAIREHCPNATLVIDRFHVVKALNEAVDEVRTEQWRALDAQGRKAIKGLRWLLSMHSSHRTKGHTRFLNSLRTVSVRSTHVSLGTAVRDPFDAHGCGSEGRTRWLTSGTRRCCESPHGGTGVKPRRGWWSRRGARVGSRCPRSRGGTGSMANG